MQGKRKRQLLSQNNVFTFDNIKISGMDHLFKNHENTPPEEEIAIIAPNSSTQPKKRRKLLKKEVSSSPKKQIDLFEKANQHMEQITIAEEEHAEKRMQMKREQEEYDRQHMTKEKGNATNKSRLKDGMLSNNYVKTNLKRKTRRFTRRVASKRTNVKLEALDDELSEADEVPATESDDSKSIDSISKESIGLVLNPETSQAELKNIAKKFFGYDTFREGQIDAVSRIINYRSTLTILPTGLGKSFCYQLAALIMTSKHFQESDDGVNNIALVISPLISLMSDQIRQLPDCLPGECLTSSQTKKQRNTIFSKIKSGQIKILFISPERLCSDNFLQQVVNNNCRIAFACVDEAHCVSEWSHNFRPSYLHIRNALDKFDVDTILALTATATKMTETDICKRLFKMDDDNDEYSDYVIRGTVCRKNLLVSVSHVRTSDERFAEVTQLLRSDRFKNCDSIIIYTTTKNEADLLCQHLQLHMKDVPGIIKSYHAGLSASQRTSIQKQFIANEVRIIVATVAFGMGINKKDVRSVIHFSLPRSIESYVQEIGRAGRDGLDSPCHLLLSEEDVIRLRSLVFGERISEIDVKRFLQVLVSNGSGEYLSGTNDLEQKLDMPSTIIRTLLTHLELQTDMEPVLRMNANVKHRYTVYFLSTHPTQLAQSNKLVQAILHCKQKATKNGQHIFNIADVCAETLKTSAEVESELEALQNSGEIKYTAVDEAFSIDVFRIPNAEEQGFLAKWLFSKMRDLETNTLWKLDEMYKLACSSACLSLSEFLTQSEDVYQKQQKLIQKHISRYFTEPSSNNERNLLVDMGLIKTVEQLNVRDQGQIKGDISALLRKHGLDVLSNGKIIARILHGLRSPCFEPEQWMQGNFWGRYRHIDFPALESLCTRVLIDYKSQ